MVRGTQSLNLEKFKIFCFIHAKKIKQARSLLELTAETSKLDKFFINKTNFLIGLNSNKGEPNYDNVFNAHLTLLTNDEVEIKYENFSKSKDLRNYFFKSGLSNQLLDNVLKDTSAENKNKLNKLDSSTFTNIQTMLTTRRKALNNLLGVATIGQGLSKSKPKSKSKSKPKSNLGAQQQIYYILSQKSGNNNLLMKKRLAKK